MSLDPSLLGCSYWIMLGVVVICDLIVELFWVVWSFEIQSARTPRYAKTVEFNEIPAGTSYLSSATKTQCSNGHLFGAAALSGVCRAAWKSDTTCASSTLPGPLRCSVRMPPGWTMGCAQGGGGGVSFLCGRLSDSASIFAAHGTNHGEFLREGGRCLRMPVGHFASASCRGCRLPTCLYFSLPFRDQNAQDVCGRACLFF
jgi:hypothetical protein